MNTQLQQRKKQLQKEQPEAWENRLVAKHLTSEEFTQRYHEGE